MEHPDQNIFFFENKWLLDPDFTSLVSEKWQEAKGRRPESCYSVDAWHGNLCMTRQFLKGWGIKQAGEKKKLRSSLLAQLESINRDAEVGEISASCWEERYGLENALEQIYQQEEIHWKQRGDLTWLVEGDSNTRFFHQFANGRRRKNTIISLDTDQGEVKTQEEIMAHATNFYKSLFGSPPQIHLKLSPNFWNGRGVRITGVSDPRGGGVNRVANRFLS